MYRDQILAELEALPNEYLPFFLQLMRAFRESVTLKPAADSFRQGWREAQRGETSSVETLWKDDNKIMTGRSEFYREFDEGTR